MLKLTNITKYYNSNNMVAIGMQDISLEFNIGEFVAITGESGSGKSTLLNVLSGNHNYDEGEMLVNGSQTSHYSVQDWENYRGKYISFIFQDYKLVDSYTVLQNVELSLFDNIPDRKARRVKAKELIEKVGLTDHIKHKATKLSGGQKQRVAIARALAKDCPIILADEPTGNLDSKMGKEIMNLLHEISKDKLVIIVTHDFEDIEDFATRKIRFFDGGIAEDKRLSPIIVQSVDNTNPVPINQMKIIPAVTQLSLQNLASTPKKTALLSVSIFITMFMIMVVSCALSPFIFNMNSSNLDRARDRVVVTSEIGFTNEQIKFLQEIGGVTRIDYNDYIRETISFNPNSVYGYSGILIRCVEDDAGYRLVEGTQDIKDGQVLVPNYYKWNHAEEINIMFQPYYYSVEENSDIPDYEGESFEIVGYVEVNSYNDAFYLTKNDFDRYCDYNQLIKTIQVISDEEIDVDASENMVIDLALDENTILLPSKLRTKVEFLLNDKIYPITENITNINILYSGSMIRISSDIAEMLIESMKIGRVSLIVDNPYNARGIDSLIKDIEREGMSVVYPYELGMNNNIATIGISIGMNLLKMMMIGIILSMVYVITTRVMKTKYKDYIILRTLGYNKRFLKLMMVTEYLMISIASIIPALIISFILRVNKVEIFMYASFVEFIVIPLIVLAILGLIALKNSNKVYNKSVNSSFEEAKE